MMNILYYIPTITKQDGGIYQYSLALLKSLAKNTPHKFFVYHLLGSNEFAELQSAFPDKIFLLKKHELKEPFSSFFKRGILKACKFFLNSLGIKNKIYFSSHLEHVIGINHIDIVHSPTQSLPIYASVPKVVTMHDVQHLYFPHYFSDKEKMDRAIHFTDALNYSNAIVVSYEHIKKSLQFFFKVNAEKIFICLLDMEDLWFEKYVNGDVTLTEIVIDKEVNIYHDFILYPAATWQHKNHLKLIEAISFLKNEKNIIVNLICTGKRTDFYPTIDRKMEELDIASQVKFLDIVSDKTLFMLYRSCKGVVIPSLYEAGSFPLMESLLMNVPVICSNVTSLPETIGCSDFVFDPNNVVDLANKIEMLIFDSSYRTNNLSNSLIQSLKLRNNDISSKIDSIYNAIIHARKNT